MLNLVPIRRGWYTAIKESFLFRALCCFDWPLSQFCVICSIWSYTEENGLLPLKNLWTSGLSSALVVPCLHAPFWGASPKRVSIRVDLCVILYSFVHPSPLDLRPPRGWVWPPKGQLRLLGSLQSLTQAALGLANAFHGLGEASHELASALHRLTQVFHWLVQASKKLTTGSLDRIVLLKTYIAAKILMFSCSVFSISYGFFLQNLFSAFVKWQGFCGFPLGAMVM